MLIRLKTAFTIISFFLFLLMGNQALHAAWWDADTLPVPPGAREEKKETRSISGQEMLFTYYISEQGAAEIKDFYRRKLAQAGWSQKEPLKEIDVSKFPGLQTDNIKQAFEYNLLFEKEDNLAILTLFPGGFYRDGMTRFSVCRGKIGVKPQAGDTVAVPELLAKPKKDVAPVYPGAALVTLSENARSLSASYFSQDEIEPVISFYKSKMSAYGWSLVRETRLEKMDTRDCPTCQKAPGIPGKPVEAWSKEMNFRNQRGDLCKIGLSEIITGSEAAKPVSITTISVSYEEKTK
ncbi:MAG: hypothetical protein WC321_06280 [Candidatus Omnitrophota bacterium]|jgi:hypothetical protein